MVARGLVLLCSLTLAAGCPATSTGTPEPESGLAGEVIAHLGSNVVVPALEAFVVDAGAARDAAAAWRDGSGSRDDARATWRAAMLTWQRLEVMQLGPAGTAGIVAGGMAVGLVGSALSVRKFLSTPA